MQIHNGHRNMFYMERHMHTGLRPPDGVIDSICAIDDGLQKMHKIGILDLVGCEFSDAGHGPTFVDKITEELYGDYELKQQDELRKVILYSSKYKEEYDAAIKQIGDTMLEVRRNLLESIKGCRVVAVNRRGYEAVLVVGVISNIHMNISINTNREYYVFDHDDEARLHGHEERVSFSDKDVDVWPNVSLYVDTTDEEEPIRIEGDSVIAIEHKNEDNPKMGFDDAAEFAHVVVSYLQDKRDQEIIEWVKKNKSMFEEQDISDAPLN